MLRTIIVTIIANGLAVVAAAWLIPGIWLGGDTWQETAVSAGLVAVVLGLVNAVVRPIVRFVTLPLIWLTLGLFIVVVNAAMLMLTSWLSEQLGLAFRVDGFFWAGVLGAIVVSIVTMLVQGVLTDGRRERD